MTPLFWIWFGFWGFVTWHFVRAFLFSIKQEYTEITALSILLYQLLTILYIAYCA